MSPEKDAPRPTKAAIESLAQSLVQRRVDSAEKAAASAAKLAEVREQLRAAERQYRTDYSSALNNSWTARELASLGITAPAEQRQTVRRAKPTKSGRATERS